MSDVTLLRKLSRKSFIKFGQYTDLTVQQLIDIKKSNYLRWVYFNCSSITFMDDILDEIKIPISFRFDKPNKNTELGIELDKEIKTGYSDGFKKKLEKKKIKYDKKRIAKNEIKDKIMFSKDKMRARNHGN